MSPSSPVVSVWGVNPWSMKASLVVRLLIWLSSQSQKHYGEFGSHMSFMTASLINPMYNSALFDQGVPSSRALKVVPMSLQISSLQMTFVHQTCQPQKNQGHQLPWQTA